MVSNVSRILARSTAVRRLRSFPLRIRPIKAIGHRKRHVIHAWLHGLIFYSKLQRHPNAYFVAWISIVTTGVDNRGQYIDAKSFSKKAARNIPVRQHTWHRPVSTPGYGDMIEGPIQNLLYSMNCKDSGPELLWEIPDISHPRAFLLLLVQERPRSPHLLKSAESTFASESAMNDFGVSNIVPWQA
jgi:hypothetical protein